VRVMVCMYVLHKFALWTCLPTWMDGWMDISEKWLCEAAFALFAFGPVLSWSYAFRTDHPRLV